MQNVDGYTAEIWALTDFANRHLYIVWIGHADGSREDVKIPVVR